MKRLNLTLLASLLTIGLGVSLNAHADVTAEGAWVRGTVSQQKATGAFMTLKSNKATQLISASSPAADLVEVHEMVMEGNAMKMRAIPALNLPANTPVELKPGSYHIMLMNLKKPLTEGEKVAITLNFVDGAKQKESLELHVPVQAMTHMHQPIH